MQVRIDENCFENVSDLNDLDEIFGYFKSEKHKWIDIDLELLQETEWYKGLGKRDLDLLKNYLFKSSTRKSISKKTIIVNNDLESEFNVFEANFYLKQPLTIIVENYEHEPVFINSIIEKFDNLGELTNAKNMQLLNYENGGGANDNTIKGKIKESFNNPLLKKEKFNYLRCFIIKDSDSDYCLINADESITIKVLDKSKTRFLEQNKIFYHILYKREKENYMPDSIYNYFLQSPKRKDKKKEFAKAYLKLSHSQKDFLDVEKGFSEKIHNGRKVTKRDTLKEEIQNLYSSLTDKDYEDIGLGLEFSNFKSEFSKYFKDVSKVDLEKRIRHQKLEISKVNPTDKAELNEFEHIIREIKYLL